MKNSLKTQQIFKSERHNVFTKKKKKKDCFKIKLLQKNADN